MREVNNRLFVVDKPIFISSNGYLRRVKREFNLKKAGFSGTLDPFATGCLIVASGQYTKLFRYLNKSPKSYRATLWLGVESNTLDLEGIDKISHTPKISLKKIEQTLNSFIGDIEYLPPKFSAKKVDGKRAYEVARAGGEIELKSIKSTIYSIELLNYSHPFLTFEITVSEGAYIRSIGSLIAKKLNTTGALSSLRRLKEGSFNLEDRRDLDPLNYLKVSKNIYLGNKESLELGKKLDIKDFKLKDDGVYIVVTDEFFSIIEIKNEEVKYLLNRIKRFKKEA